MPQQHRTIRVLSVDDHAFLSEGLRARLALEPDMEVVAATTRADGISAKIRDEAADIILLDIEMPGMDPFEALAEIRKHCPSARAIILSAYVRDRYVDTAVKAGAWGYLSKSDPPESIVAAIRDVAAGKFTFGPTVLERCRQIGRDEPGLSFVSAGVEGAMTPGGPAGPEGSSPADEAGGQAGSGGVGPASRLGALTPRELQILRLIGKGMSRTEIAKVIFRSPKTVDAHRAAIMEKLAIRDRVELARYAIREGLVEL